MNRDFFGVLICVFFVTMMSFSYMSRFHHDKSIKVEAATSRQPLLKPEIKSQEKLKSQLSSQKTVNNVVKKNTNSNVKLPKYFSTCRVVVDITTVEPQDKAYVLKQAKLLTGVIISASGIKDVNVVKLSAKLTDNEGNVSYAVLK